MYSRAPAITMTTIAWLQAVARGFLARRRYAQRKADLAKAAATTIQCAWRCHVARGTQTTLLATRTHAAMSLQQRFRALQSMRQAVHAYTRVRSATVLIQRVFRQWQARVETRRQTAATTIQAVYRMHVARQTLRAVKSACVSMQTTWRTVLAQRQLVTLRILQAKRVGAATAIQVAHRVIVSDCIVIS